MTTRSCFDATRFEFIWKPLLVFLFSFRGGVLATVQSTVSATEEVTHGHAHGVPVTDQMPLCVESVVDADTETTWRASGGL